jgi:hypothetical protein
LSAPLTARRVYARRSHGGGYAFRLCKKDRQTSCLTEEDFLKLPYLQFEKTELRWNDGTTEEINGTYITDGTYPPGSMWAMNPLPQSPSEEFPPPCKSGTEPQVRAPMALGKYGHNPGRCAGNWPTTVTIMDTLRIPADTAKGDYVLSWCAAAAAAAAAAASPSFCVPPSVPLLCLLSAGWPASLLCQS